MHLQLLCYLETKKYVERGYNCDHFGKNVVIIHRGTVLFLYRFFGPTQKHMCEGRVFSDR